MELQVPHSICAEISAAGDLPKDKGRHRNDTAKIVRQQRSDNTRSRSMSGSCAYAGEHTATYQCSTVYGISERLEFVDDLR